MKTTTIQCAGKAFLEYQAVAAAGDNLDDMVSSNDKQEETPETGTASDEDAPEAVDLFSLSEKQLADLNYYKVLNLPYRAHLTPDDVKKGYRKASLKYHPDKSGRGEEDAVFLKVKAAFETLSTQKQAYDSTEMPFDDSIPEENPDDFFDAFGPAFERNLHFDARLLPKANNGNANGSAKKKNNRRKSRNSQTAKNLTLGPPPLGDTNTPIDEVHAFYDYWTHFTSWRDFTLKAARELETQEHLENAESRYEKRWYQKEIDRAAKKLKQQEQARITSLVERAMAVDPRLVQERKRLIKEKEEKQRQREQDALDKKRKEEEESLAKEKRIQEEKERKTQEKFQREKEKKMLRKAKAGLRKIVAAALEALLEKEYALEDATDTIFEKLNKDQILRFNTKLEALKDDPSAIFKAVKTRAENIEKGIDDADDGDEIENEAPKLVNETNGVQNGDNQTMPVNPAEDGPSKPTAVKASNKKVKVPFTKEEMSALAKGIKKYPAGGANRWDQIALYINNICQPENPRTKEECIEVFNQNKAKGPPGAAAPQAATEPAPVDGWTEELDKLLQEGLAKYPADMDKNERWTSIAKSVPGKTKKDCVSRFKAIREAIKNKK